MNLFDNYLTVLKLLPQKLNLYPIEDVWDVVERARSIIDLQATNLQQLHDAVLSTFQHFVEYEEFRQFLKRSPTKNVFSHVLPNVYINQHATWQCNYTMVRRSYTHMLIEPVCMYNNSFKAGCWLLLMPQSPSAPHDSEMDHAENLHVAWDVCVRVCVKERLPVGLNVVISMSLCMISLL